ncbi:hypothetical protein FS837_002521 [Tulasnella sp. UAMH 9824]|nr:hypothetical protein FS837_002521 [Tulasnella sp. UAMH 9824]
MRDKKAKQPAWSRATPWGADKNNTLNYVGGQLKPQPNKKGKDLADSPSQEQIHSEPNVSGLGLILPISAKSWGRPLSQAEIQGLGNPQAAN